MNIPSNTLSARLLAGTGTLALLSDAGTSAPSGGLNVSLYNSLVDAP